MEGCGQTAAQSLLKGLQNARAEVFASALVFVDSRQADQEKGCPNQKADAAAAAAMDQIDLLSEQGSQLLSLDKEMRVVLLAESWVG